MAGLLRVRSTTPDLVSYSSQSTGEREDTPLSQRAATPDAERDTFFAFPHSDLISHAGPGNEPQQAPHYHQYAISQQDQLWDDAAGLSGIQGEPIVDEEWWTKELSSMGSAEVSMQGATAAGSMLLSNQLNYMSLHIKPAEEPPFAVLSSNAAVPACFYDPSQLSCFQYSRDPTPLHVSSGYSSGSSSPPASQETDFTMPIPRAAPSLPHTARTARTAASCGWCGRGFRRLGDIPRHQRTSCSKKPRNAPPSEPFQCGSCNHRHLRRDKMQKHCREYHDQSPGSEEFT